MTSGISFLQPLSYSCNVDILRFSIFERVGGMIGLYCRGKRTGFVSAALSLMAKAFFGARVNISFACSAGPRWAGVDLYIQMLAILFSTGHSSAAGRGRDCSRFHHRHAHILRLFVETFFHLRWCLPLVLPAWHQSRSRARRSYVWLYSVAASSFMQIVRNGRERERYRGIFLPAFGQCAIMFIPRKIEKGD